jgi:tetratricopeptide (TPR) repeat protein
MRIAARTFLLLPLLATAGCASGAFQPRAEDIPALERAAARTPADAELLTRLGAAYHAAGRHEDARRLLQQAVDSGAAGAATHLYLGLASEALEEWSAARTAYTTYLTQAGSARIRNQVRGRLAIIARNEARALAAEALAQEDVLSQQPATPNTVAVMPFVLSGLPEELQPLRTALADMVITDLSFTALRSVERVRVQSMIDEMVLTQAGYTTAETGARMGRLLRAQNVVQGLITGTDDRLALNATVLHTELGAGRDVAQAGQLDAIFELQKQMVFAILDALGIVPTARERDAITGNRTGSLMAFIAYGNGLEAMDRGDYTAALDYFREAARLDPGFRAAGAQRAEAQLITSAATIDNLGSLAAVEIGSIPIATLTQQIVDQVNHSPASSMTQTQTATSATTSQHRNPATEQQPESPLSTATKATVEVVVPNPIRPSVIPRPGGGP